MDNWICGLDNCAIVSENVDFKNDFVGFA